MNTGYSERQLVDGAIARKYDDGTYLVYLKWDPRNVYIRLIHSINPGKGIARAHLIDFLKHRKNKNIYTYVSSELGADLDLLKTFYSSNGFKEIKKTEVRGERVNYKLTAE